MAETQQQQTEQKGPKFSLFKVHLWPRFIWDWAVRKPGIRRLRIGRKKVS